MKIIDRLGNGLGRALTKHIRSNPKGELWLSSIQRRLLLLYGSQHLEERMVRYLSGIVIGALSITLGFLLLFVIVERQLLYVLLGPVLAVCYVLLQVRALDHKLELRKRQLLLELPELMNRLALLVDAGESVQQAVLHCAKPNTGDQPGLLIKELDHAMLQFRQGGETFASSMESFAKRCGVQEVTQFTTMVLLYYRRGGGDFVHTMRGLMRELWEKRKSIVRTIGEEASSKLIFPMMVIFIVIMAVIAYPAVRMMG
jgi:tight adherence protein C